MSHTTARLGKLQCAVDRCSEPKNASVKVYLCCECSQVLMHADMYSHTRVKSVSVCVCVCQDETRTKHQFFPVSVSETLDMHAVITVQKPCDASMVKAD